MIKIFSLAPPENPDILGMMLMIYILCGHAIVADDILGDNSRNPDLLPNVVKRAGKCPVCEGLRDEVQMDDGMAMLAIIDASYYPC